MTSEPLTSSKAVLQRLAKQAECLQSAARCRAHAEQLWLPSVKIDMLEMAATWETLAQSYACSDHFKDFLSEVKLPGC
jgi:hypothetical protein